MTQLKHILNAMLALFIFTAAPLAAEDTRESTLVNRFKQGEKMFIVLEGGISFEVVSDSWKCNNWLPGDSIQIKRLYGYSAFDFEITNTEADRVVYAKYANVEGESHLLRKRMDLLEERIARLENLIF